MENILDLQNQSSLAKLLATENITVTHSKSLSTAYFDVKNRVLGLPVWKNQGKVVYDMLVGHEVSHALYTPQKEFSEFLEVEGRSHFDILNIVEDIRIERLIKLTYAGMPRIFNGAYKNLVESDFFKVEGKDFNELNFLDRLNLHAKIGPHANIPLSEEELALYNKCMKAESFEDVVALYHEIKAFTEEEAKQKAEEKSEAEDEESDEESAEDQNSEEGDEAADDEESKDSAESSNSADDGEESFANDTNDTEEDSDADTSEGVESDTESVEESLTSASDEDAGGASSSSTGEDLEPTHKSETQEAFKKAIADDTENTDHQVITLMPTKKNIEQHIIPYSKVLDGRPSLRSALANCRHPDDIDSAVASINSKLIDFKKKTNKKVGVLVREFERRKASYQYSRAQESRRGSLDVNNLHKYKYDDQIFQTTTRLADAKSHGMIFFVDYSGSMSIVLRDVLEHTLNLVHFCKRVGIPFEVYGFTSDYRQECDLDDSQSDLEFDMSGTMIFELFSSKMSKSDYEKAFVQVSQQILLSGSNFSQHACSQYEWLGGTPLDATLLAAHHIVNKFNKRYSVQKTNVIILSDGDSHRCEPKGASYRTRSYLTNINGKQYDIPKRGMTARLTKILSETTGANLIGFFLPQCNRTIRTQLSEMSPSKWDDISAKVRKYKKDGFAVAHNAKGYDSYFLLPSDVRISDDEFKFGSDSVDITDSRAAQTKLARDYAKHNLKNRQSRIILTKFAELIA